MPGRTRASDAGTISWWLSHRAGDASFASSVARGPSREFLKLLRLGSCFRRSVLVFISAKRSLPMPGSDPGDGAAGTINRRLSHVAGDASCPWRRQRPQSCFPLISRLGSCLHRDVIGVRNNRSS
jgi:hypothetical protein